MQNTVVRRNTLFETEIRSIVSDTSLSCIVVDSGIASGTNNSVELARTDGNWGSGSNRRFLVASITKPLVAMAVLKLAAQGEMSLSERVGSFLPEFCKGAYRRITVRHLLTHTSGLPDMLPDNAELRASQASLPDFQKAAAAVKLDFGTGTDCRYSSAGYLLLGAIIDRCSSVSCADYLDREFFQPMKMSETWLGVPEARRDELLPGIERCQLPFWQQDAETWDWNSSYWRTLGAPWGGLISTAADLARYARMILSEGATESGRQILPAKVVAAAQQDQLASLADEPGFTGSPRPWGFGWRRQWPAHHASFGDFVSAETFGHWGATGTLMWIDPVNENYAVVLTATPYEQSQPYIQRISNVIASA